MEPKIRLESGQRQQTLPSVTSHRHVPVTITYELKTKPLSDENRLDDADAGAAGRGDVCAGCSGAGASTGAGAGVAEAAGVVAGASSVAIVSLLAQIRGRHCDPRQVCCLRQSLLDGMDVCSFTLPLAVQPPSPHLECYPPTLPGVLTACVRAVCRSASSCSGLSLRSRRRSSVRFAALSATDDVTESPDTLHTGLFSHVIRTHVIGVRREVGAKSSGGVSGRDTSTKTTDSLPFDSGQSTGCVGVPCPAGRISIEGGERKQTRQSSAAPRWPHPTEVDAGRP